MTSLVSVYKTLLFYGFIHIYVEIFLCYHILCRLIAKVYRNGKVLYFTMFFSIFTISVMLLALETKLN